MKPVERSELESRDIQEARAVRREAREQLGLAGGVVFIAGMAATAAGVAVALPIAVIVLAGLGGAYAFPTSERGRCAKAILNERDAFRLPLTTRGVWLRRAWRCVSRSMSVHPLPRQLPRGQW
jgi:hypothetical protein